MGSPAENQNKHKLEDLLLWAYPAAGDFLFAGRIHTKVERGKKVGKCVQ